MPMAPLPLGPVPLTGSVGTWLLMQLELKAKPLVEKFLDDPVRSISRVGDVLVWQGERGTQVVAALEGLTESQQRIEQVVSHIEKTQLGVASSLGTLTSMSMATLGVTSMAAGFMVWRLNALHQRLSAIASQISDIQASLNAQNQAYLATAIAFLKKHELGHSYKNLHAASEASTFATNLYRELVQREADGPRRLLALNQCGRYYLLALTAQVRCLILSNELPLAEQCLQDQKTTISALAKATFEKVIGNCPEQYLRPELQADHVTLELMTEIYQQAHQLGALSEVRIQVAGQMFEYLRKQIYGAGKGWLPRFRSRQATLLDNLKYLMACLEEAGRIESLHWRVKEALAGKLSFEELEKAVDICGEEHRHPSGSKAQTPVVAFAFG